MKKVSVSVFLILVVAVCYGQLGFGIKSGYNLTHVKSDSSEFGNLTGSAGLNLGIFLTFPINEKMNIQTDIGFSGGGFNAFSQTFENDGQNVRSSVHDKRYVLNYISIPVMAKYSF